jgi:hypothetical protein
MKEEKQINHNWKGFQSLFMFRVLPLSFLISLSQPQIESILMVMIMIIVITVP